MSKEAYEARASKLAARELANSRAAAAQQLAKLSRRPGSLADLYQTSVELAEEVAS